MNGHRRARLWRTIILMSVASALLLVWVLPLIWAVVVSLKSEREVLAYPPNVIFEPTWTNYADEVPFHDTDCPAVRGKVKCWECQRCY